MKAAKHADEARRLAALRAYEILDTEREADFDDIVALAARICEAPISVVNLIDAERQWFKAEVGLGVRETPIDSSICAHAILEESFVEIPDTQQDCRMVDNPLCLGDPSLRFYAGTLLKTAEGLPLGTLCILDYKPRRLDDLQRDALVVLGRQVMTQLDLRAALRRQRLLAREIDHRVKNSLAAVTAIIRLQARRAPDEATRRFLAEVEKRVARVATLHGHLYRAGGAMVGDIGAYLRTAAELMADSLPPEVRVDVEAEPLEVDAMMANALGVIATEFIMNAAKHAFPDERPGTISIVLRRDGSDAIVMSCSDDGIGASAPASEAGLGLRLIAASAAQLGGHAAIGGGAKGFRVEVRMPLPIEPAPR